MSQTAPASRDRGLSNSSTITQGTAQTRPTKYLLEDRWAAGGVLALVVIAGTAIRTYGLYGRSMWFDESMSWRTVQFPFGEMIVRVIRNSHAPFYFVCLKLWVAVFGESLFALRSLSLVFAAVTMVGVFLFASEAFERNGSTRDLEPQAKGRARWIGLAATLFFAVSVYQIRLAWEIRMYTLGTALVALSSWVLFRAVSPPRQSWRPWVVFALLTILFAYTHYFALFSIASQAIFVTGYILADSRWNVAAALRSARFRMAAMAYGIVAVGWAPWLPVFLRQRQQVKSGWWMPPFSFSDVPDVFWKTLIDPGGQASSKSQCVMLALACAIVLAAILRRGKVGEWYVVCLGVLPLTMAIAASWVATNVLVARYLAFSQLFILVAFAVALKKISEYLLRNMVTTAVVGVGLWLHVSFVESLDIPSAPGARGAAAYIAANRRQDEPVIACSTLLYYPMLYHAHDRTGWHVYDDDAKVPFYVGGSLAIDQDFYVPAQMEAIRSERAWVITTSGTWGRSDIHIPQHWRRMTEKRFREVSWFPNDIVVITYTIVPDDILFPFP